MLSQILFQNLNICWFLSQTIYTTCPHLAPFCQFCSIYYNILNLVSALSAFYSYTPCDCSKCQNSRWRGENRAQSTGDVDPAITTAMAITVCTSLYPFDFFDGITGFYRLQQLFTVPAFSHTVNGKLSAVNSKHRSTNAYNDGNNIVHIPIAVRFLRWNHWLLIHFSGYP